MILLTDEQEEALLEDLRAIPGTADVIAALILSRRRHPDLWRFTWPERGGTPSRWQPMPVCVIKSSAGNPTVEYAYVR